MKELKGFVTCDTLINNEKGVISPVMEISDLGLTYSKNRKQYYSDVDPIYSLHAFWGDEERVLKQKEVNNIINVVVKFTAYITKAITPNKQEMMIQFTNFYNQLNPVKPVTNFIFNNVIKNNDKKSVDYLSFTVDGFNCCIWLSDLMFQAFYPHYDISIVLPILDFKQTISNIGKFTEALKQFDLEDFNRRIEADKGNNPTTYSRIMNIPLHMPNSKVTKPCYFGFNIYGAAGNYDYILKQALYDYLVNELKIPQEIIDILFPTLKQFNEIFVIPMFSRIAIPSQVGKNCIYSQVTATYTEPFDIAKFVSAYYNIHYFKKATYNLSSNYNNMMLRVVNPEFGEPGFENFFDIYNDLITVSSMDPDYARMKQRSQRIITLFEAALPIADTIDPTSTFNAVLKNKDYKFSLVTRKGVTYITVRSEIYQLFLLPKWEFERLDV